MYEPEPQHCRTCSRIMMYRKSTAPYAVPYAVPTVCSFCTWGLETELEATLTTRCIATKAEIACDKSWENSH